jgi:ribose-phosphate pyrophosphokinase
MKTSPPLIFGIKSYLAMAQTMAKLGTWKLGKIERVQFPDGERYQRITNSVAGRDVILVGGTVGDSETLELFDLACALAKYGAKRLDLVIPYFGYSTMERAVKAGEIVTAKTRARLLSAIPGSAQGNRVFFLDLHAEGLPHYLEGDITAYHIYAKPLVMKAAKELAGRKFVLASTDAGRAKWVQSLATDLGVEAAFVFKKRLDARRTAVSAVSANVKGQAVIIYDDMIRTGGSLLNAAQAYRNAGAASIDVITTHGLFPENSLAIIKNSGLVRGIHTTDSHPHAFALAGSFLKVHPVAPLLVKAIKDHP